MQTDNPQNSNEEYSQQINTELERNKHNKSAQKADIQPRICNFWSVFVAILCVGFITGAVLEFKFGILPESFSAETPEVDYKSAKKLYYNEPLSEMIADAVEVSSKSVVSITAKSNARTSFDFPFSYGNRPESHLGTGVVYAVVRSIAYIITNNHVIRNATEIYVSQDDRLFRAKLVGLDPATDLALLKIDIGSYKLTPAQFADSDMLKPGYIVVAMGQPYGFENTATMGIVSALGRGDIFRTGGYADFIQTSAQINPGNSGGPLVDLKGKVIGINTFIYSETRGNVGIGFAIPANLVLRVAEDLIKYGLVKRSELGVTIRALSAEERMQLGKGILIDQVMPDSSAEKAGLKHMDIIRRLNEETVENDVWLKTKIAHFKPGESVKITILRDGKEIEIEVQLTEKK
ncbi:MAG: trypsin-like peptidase domain-containing protein [Planctomycetes bacterium]|nr:trypsin-like peptidase domain-containing protein [Planctomycetota bacterium]